MTNRNGRHDPSYYRSLIREKKSKMGRHPEKLIKKARFIEDPYYSSLALIRLSDDKRISIPEAKLIAMESIRKTNEVEREWRRGELLSKLAKYAKKWRGKKAVKHQEYLLNQISKEIKKIPKGKDLSQTINKVVKNIGCKRIFDILKLAINNKNFELNDSRTVIRHWAKKCCKKIPPEDIFDELKKIDRGLIRAKLLGYLHLQCTRLSIERTKVLKEAIDAALSEKDQKRKKALRYLARHISSKQDFNLMKKSLKKMKNPTQKADIEATLAGSADKSNLSEISLMFFKKSLQNCKNI
ncbi:MAG: hypothetical protein V5A68_01300, partial [Candidatus Thermoplasmatota archaeon]